jgi:hypothetical protein
MSQKKIEKKGGRDDEIGSNFIWRGEIACNEIEMLFGLVHEPRKATAWLKEVLYGN